jgi:flavin reductase (DIM6/NTAB) family NADH-FMN oxidoreductase RutF
MSAEERRALDSAPYDPRAFRNALGTFATGITVITARAADGDFAGLTNHESVHSPPSMKALDRCTM